MIFIVWRWTLNNDVEGVGIGEHEKQKARLQLGQNKFQMSLTFRTLLSNSANAETHHACIHMLVTPVYTERVTVHA